MQYLFAYLERFNLL